MVSIMIKRFTPRVFFQKKEEAREELNKEGWWWTDACAHTFLHVHVHTHALIDLLQPEMFLIC